MKHGNGEKIVESFIPRCNESILAGRTIERRIGGAQYTRRWRRFHTAVNISRFVERRTADSLTLAWNPAGRLYTHFVFRRVARGITKLISARCAITRNWLHSDFWADPATFQIFSSGISHHTNTWRLRAVDFIGIGYPVRSTSLFSLFSFSRFLFHRTDAYLDWQLGIQRLRFELDLTFPPRHHHLLFDWTFEVAVLWHIPLYFSSFLSFTFSLGKILKTWKVRCRLDDRSFCMA